MIKQNNYSTLKELANLKYALDKSAIVAITDKQGVITYVNNQFCKISKYKQTELLGNTHQIINSHYHPPSYFQHMWETILSKKVWHGEIKNRAKDGSFYWTSTTIVPCLNDIGELYQFIAIRFDITKRIEAEKTLENVLKNDFKQTLEHLQNGIFKVQKNNKHQYIFTLAEGKLAQSLRFTTAHLHHLTLFDIFPKDTAQILSQHFDQAFQKIDTNFELELSGSYYYIHLSPIYKDNHVYEIVGSVVDITEQKKNEAIIYQLAHYDRLTNLPNRSKFQSILENYLEHANATAEPFAILFINLDRFKIINDMFGHSIGDELLMEVSRRLENEITLPHIVGRFGGDEFIILLKNVSKQITEKFAKKILSVISKKLNLKHVETYITPSIGISQFPVDGKHYEDLIKKADAAMHHAKAEGKSTYRFFDHQLQANIQRQLAIETALHEVLEKEQLSLHYQPKIYSETGTLIGAEALLRWQHPALGFISPVEFIPIAEETSLIIPIGEWVLEEAVKQMKQWCDQGFNDFTLSVNVSVKQLTGSNFVKSLDKIIKKYNIAPNCLQIEITESATMNIHEALHILNDIKKLGVSISIDDFGTGYSSLKYLRHLPIDVLKIDQSFVRELTDTNKSIIKTIISLAQNMNLSIIAEGVETVEHVTFLKAQMCTEMQGYYFSKPLPKDAFEALLNIQQWDFQATKGVQNE